jgi:hypothetical protein
MKGPALRMTELPIPPSVMRSAGPFMPPMGKSFKLSFSGAVAKSICLQSGGFRPPMMQGNMGLVI